MTQDEYDRIKDLPGIKVFHLTKAQWEVLAKAAGYPLCEECREPIVKSRWKQLVGRRTLCGSCEMSINNLNQLG